MDPGDDGLGWIRRANARPIGRVEFRLVRMEIGAGRRPRVLRIATLRHADGDVARTVCCVLEPRPLANVNYVVTERRGCIEPFEIALYLPYLFGTLRHLGTERRREGLLGCDFAYDDLRTWLYEEGHRYETVEAMPGEVRVRGRCTGRADLVRHGAFPFDVRIDRATAFVTGVDYRSPDGSAITREYRAEEPITVDGVLIPQRMTMTDHGKDHATTIRLERAWYDRDIDPAVFDGPFRRQTRAYLQGL